MGEDVFILYKRALFRLTSLKMNTCSVAKAKSLYQPVHVKPF